MCCGFYGCFVVVWFASGCLVCVRVLLADDCGRVVGWLLLVSGLVW